ncbi:hypothetical protein [Sulfitobacter sabulilitoris]|uniref:Uncharacterized protein n=1 Tax=Sulfitobacter sabulilitoris TaxID=2562655 RepID=A0A5S3PKD5_9RHOB|nr:hypothetical protein [Sulfitobacter sabulilitoris]TMM54781.1 hypothetical protein FDT80_04150 [Sulfitobacter sabulilitoris]
MTRPDGQVDFEAFLLLIGKLNYSWTNTESLLIHLIAGLCRIDKDPAVVIFLTLNTTRARIDLVNRLSKLETTPTAQRDAILGVTGRMQKLSALRNRYNHCIYAFDAEGGNPRTVLMRIADRKETLRMGQVNELNDAAAGDVEDAISELQKINLDIWGLIRKFDYPV